MGNLLLINKFIYPRFFLLWIGIILTLLSSNWFIIWIGLEINLLGFLMIIFIKQKSLEIIIKYFIIQRSRSSVYLFSSLILNYEFFNIITFHWRIILLLSIIIIIVKLGAAPIHFWLINIRKNLKWFLIFIILRIQKINPLIILSLISKNFNFIWIFIITGALIGRFQGLRQKSFELIIVLSSVTHLRWIFSCLKRNYWIIYLLIYSISLIIISILINKISNSCELYIKKYQFFFYFYFILNIISLGGFPPLLGFFPKWFILININNIFLAFILILRSVINLYFYIHIIFSIFIIKKNNWNYKIKITNKLIILPIIIFPLIGILFI
jgi:NADH-ubiquinone oxidoreductase chain 2